MPLTFDIAAIVAVGITASGFFWGLLAKIDKKLDGIARTMVTREDFNGHFHTPEAEVAIRRNYQWGVHVQHTAAGVPERGCQCQAQAAGEQLEGPAQGSRGRHRSMVP